MAAETGTREDGNEELAEKDLETEPSLTETKGIHFQHTAIDQQYSKRQQITQRRLGTPKKTLLGNV